MTVTTGLLVGSAIAGIGGSVVGSLASASERDKAAEAMQKAQEIYKNLKLPPEEFKPILISQLQNAGVWKPEMEQKIDAGISKVSQIQEDPRFKQEQLGVLAALKRMAETGGTATARASYAEAEQAAKTLAQGGLAAAQQQAQARGMAGGGTEQAQAQMAIQAAANRASQAAMQRAAQQEALRAQAVGQLGSMAGQVRGQEFGIEQAKAEAADKFKMFDISAQREQQARNIQQQNLANQYAIQNQQRIMDANVLAANQELYRQSQARRQYWQDELERSKLQAGGYMGEAETAGKSAQGIQQGWTSIGGALGQGLGAGAGYASRNELLDRLSTQPPTSAPAPGSSPSLGNFTLPQTKFNF